MRFSLRISADEYLRYYRGAVRHVVVTAEDGTRLRFPAANLRPFVTREGVRGRFVMRFDANNKLVSLNRSG